MGKYRGDFEFKGVSLNSRLRQASDQFLDIHNRNAGSFEWRRRDIFSKSSKKKYAYLHN